MRRVLLDINVVLDALLDRRPFSVEAHRLWQASDEGLFDACITSFSIPTIHYICEKQEGRGKADRAVDLCLQAFEIAPLYRECILAARRMPGPDFEDNLQIACALTDFARGIVTRNVRDFTHSPLRVYTPGEMLAELGA